MLKKKITMVTTFFLFFKSWIQKQFKKYQFEILLKIQTIKMLAVVFI